MTHGFSRAVTAVWLALLIITLTSWALGSTSEAGLDAVQRGALLALTGLKLALVLSHFMQVQHAPRLFLWLAGGWVLALTGLLLWIYQ